MTKIVTKQDELIERVQALLMHVRFKMDSLDRYSFNVVLGHGGVYLQGEYWDADIYSGIRAKQTTRKWLLSPFMTDSEIIQTAFKLCMTSMEHRTREAFAYKGARVFGPHFDIEDLVKICKDGKEDAGGRKI